MFLLKREYFNKTFIITGFYTALLLSACIYLNFFHIENKIVHTIFALLGFYQLLHIQRPSLFFTGFFVGIFWFYWVSFSFIHYDLSYLIPLIIFAFALGYALLFLFTSIINHPLMRAFFFVGLSFISPFGFNWFQPQIILLNTYFEPTKLFVLLLLISLYLLGLNKKVLFVLAIIAAFLFSYYTKSLQEPIKQSALNIAMPTFNLHQDYKWDRKNQSNIVKQNIAIIDKAIEEKKDLVILPETAFPLVLNAQEVLVEMLKEKSLKITIVTGALYKNASQYNNSTYVFEQGEIQVAHKVVLVPFGERIPLPKFIRDFINKVFYDGAQDYKEADKATDFTIQKEQFRNAICYEATHPEIYKELKDVKYIIATSNNAWFTPSIEPVLQKMLMEYYAKKHNVIIYHVVNGSQNAIIYP